MSNAMLMGSANMGALPAGTRRDGTGRFAPVLDAVAAGRAFAPLYALAAVVSPQLLLAVASAIATDPMGRARMVVDGSIAIAAVLGAAALTRGALHVLRGGSRTGFQRTVM